MKYPMSELIWRVILIDILLVVSYLFQHKELKNICLEFEIKLYYLEGFQIRTVYDKRFLIF